MPRTPRALLIAAAGCALVFTALLAAIYLTWRARYWDATVLKGFLELQPRGVASEKFAHLGDASVVGLLGAMLAGLALARGKPRHALAVIVLLAATSLSSQLIKAVIDFPRYESLLAGLGVRSAAFPSGHATAAMTLALCGVLVVPQRLRPLAAAVGALFALAVGFSVVSRGSHFPSDIAGGYLLATGETLVVLAALQAAALRWPERSGRSRARLAVASTADRVAEAGLVVTAGAAVVIGGVVAATLLIFRLPDVLGYAEAHTAFVLVASALAATAALLVAGVTATLRRRS